MSHKLSPKVLPALVPVCCMEREQKRSRRASVSKKLNFVDSPTYSPVNKICTVNQEAEDVELVFEPRQSLRHLMSESTDLSNSCPKRTPQSSRRKRRAKGTSKAKSKTPLYDDSSLVLGSSTEARGVTRRRRHRYDADESSSESETKSIISSPSSSFYPHVKTPLSIADETSNTVSFPSTSSTTSKLTRSASARARRAMITATARRRLYYAETSSSEEKETVLNVPVRNSSNTSGEGLVTHVVESIDESLMDKEKSCNLSALSPIIMPPVRSSAKGRQCITTPSTSNSSAPKTCSFQRGSSSNTSRSNVYPLNKEHEIVSSEERKNQKYLMEIAVRKLCDRHPKLKQKYEHIQTRKTSKNIGVTKIFKGVTAYVEVQDEHSDISDYVSQLLTELGARVSKSLEQTVTHFIFRNGKKSSYDKAKKMGIFIVSILWIASSKEARKKLPETKYQIVTPDFSTEF